MTKSKQIQKEKATSVLSDASNAVIKRLQQVLAKLNSVLEESVKGKKKLAQPKQSRKIVQQKPSKKSKRLKKIKKIRKMAPASKGRKRKSVK